jgi:hypothetical protein
VFNLSEDNEEEGVGMRLVERKGGLKERSGI